MELYPIHGSSPNPFFIPPHLLFPTYFIPHNYVYWTQTPDSHLYTANLPGVRKEEIRVEVEDSRYLVIRTDLTGDDGEVIGGSAAEGERRSFMRKFRLPQMVNVDGISAGYENGVLTVRVPRSLARRRPTVDDVIDLTAEEARNSVARAA